MILIIVLLIVAAVITALLEFMFGIDQDSACRAALIIVGGLIGILIWFYLFTAKGRAIVRVWNIKELRKKRIDREFHESWLRMNRKFIAKEERRMFRETDRMIKENKTNVDTTENIAPIIVSNQMHDAGGAN